MPTKQIRSLVVFFFLLVNCSCFAADGVWTNVSGGLWSVPANWTAVPRGAGDVATFAARPTHDATISLDTAITLGELRYNSPVNTKIDGPETLTFDNQSEVALISNRDRDSGFLNITAPILLNSDLRVVNRSQTRIDSSGGIRSAEGTTTDVQLVSENRGGFQMLGGMSLNGNLGITGRSKSVFVGETDFQRLLLNQEAEATFEKPFALGEIELRGASKLVIEQPSTVGTLRIRNGMIEGMSLLTVTEAVTAFQGIIDLANADGFLSNVFEKDGPETLTALNLGNDFDGQIMVRDGTLQLEYPDPFAIADGEGTGGISLTGANAKLNILSVQDAPPLRFAINLNNTQGRANSEGALHGAGVLAGPVELGDIGSSISGGFIFSGPISGGSLTLSGDHLLPDANHTYTGETVIRSGSLFLLDEGQLTNTSGIVIKNQGRLILEPKTVVQRVGDDVPIVIEKGGLGVPSVDSVSVDQTVGEVLVTGSGNVVVDTNGSLTIKSLTVDPEARLTLHLNPSRSRLWIENFADTDFVTANIRYPQAFSRYSSETGLVPLTEADLEHDVSQWTNTSHAAVQNRETLSRDATVQSLSMRSRGQDARLTVQDGSTLNVLSGGIQFESRSRINGSQAILTAGGDTTNAYLYLTGDEVQLDILVADNPGADGDFNTADDNGTVGVVVDGSVVMSGTNTYSGRTVVPNGQLTFARSTAISPNTDVLLKGGSIHLGFSGTATIKSLTLEGDGHVGGDFATIQSNLVTIKDGGFKNQITGNSHIIKESSERGSVRIDSEFSGTIDVREGILDFEQFQPLGVTYGDAFGAVVVAAGATLVFTQPGPVRNLVLAGDGEVNYLLVGKGTVLKPGVGDTIGSMRIGDLQVDDGGIYEWQLADAAGLPGEGWDQLVLHQLATVEADSPFTVKIQLPTIDGELVEIANFDPRRAYAWEIATIENPVKFAIDFQKMVIDTDSFFATHDLLPNPFSFQLAGNSLLLEYGKAADLNGDTLLDAADLDAACDQGRDLAHFLKGAFDTRVGDIDLDRTVSFEDFLVLSQNFGSPGRWGQGDLNCDSKIGFADFLLLSHNFGQQSNAASSVPEPNGVVYCLIGLVLIQTMRRTRDAS